MTSRTPHRRLQPARYVGAFAACLVSFVSGTGSAFPTVPPVADRKAPAPATPPTQLVVAPPRPAKPKPPPPPSVPAAHATLRVNAAALGTPWTFELTNADTTPLRLVTDGRLLTLDVSPPDDPAPDADAVAGDKTPATQAAALALAKKKLATKKARTVHCELPSEVRPTHDNDNARVLPPGVTYVEAFDPRLYCFDERQALGLVPGTRVVAHLGWPAPRNGVATPPFVADETFGGDERSGVKELAAEPVTTPEALEPDDRRERADRVIVTAPARVDVETGGHLLIDVTVKNPSSRPIRLMLRPETLAFEIASPRGIYSCGWRTHPGAPIAEVFNEIPPHGEISTNVLLSSVCPSEALQSAGLYSVRARLDTRMASGRGIGIETFDGRVDAVAPTLVRIRRDHARRP